MVSSDYKHLQTDLESDVRLILWNAAKKFDLAKGCRFSTYLTRCLDNTINQKIKRHCQERKSIEKYRHETSEECVVDLNSDGGYEIPVTDPFPCHDESILPELMSFCNATELAIIGLICNDEDVWHKNGSLNNAEIARKLGISREAVRQTVVNLRTNQSLRSTICELAPH
jgi:DNA-directed RNA polymerase sigma subunit (sigma70/sigma32)